MVSQFFGNQDAGGACECTDQQLVSMLSYKWWAMFECYCFCLVALPTMSAFSEYPSVAEMDVFSCFVSCAWQNLCIPFEVVSLIVVWVNYRFTVSALLDRLTRLEKEQNHNLLLHQLLAIVDQYLVNVMTAVQLLQYLVCCPPGMDIEAGKRNETALSIVTKLNLSLIHVKHVQ